MYEMRFVGFAAGMARKFRDRGSRLYLTLIPPCTAIEIIRQSDRHDSLELKTDVKLYDSQSLQSMGSPGNAASPHPSLGKLILRRTAHDYPAIDPEHFRGIGQGIR